MLEIAKLLLITVAPIAISVIGAGLFWKRKYGNFLGAFVLNPRRGLEEQGLLWISIIAPILYFIFLGFFSWADYSVLVSSKGFETFLKISVLPLSILALAIPLSILVSRFHATGQTAEQIRKSIVKNDLDMLALHRKEMYAYFDQIGHMQVDDYSPFSQAPKVHPRVHKHFFVIQGDGLGPAPNHNMFKNIESNLNSAGLHLAAMIPKIDSFDHYLAASSCIMRVAIDLGGEELNLAISKNSVLVPMIQAGAIVGEYYTIGRSNQDIVYAYRWLRAHFMNLCDFAGWEFAPAEAGATQTVDYGSYFKEVYPIDTVHLLHTTRIPQIFNEADEIMKRNNPPNSVG